MNNLKTKVDDLDVAKLKTLPVDLKQLSDVVDNEVVKNTKLKTLKTKVNVRARLKQANLVTKTDFNKKLTSLNKKITSNKTKYLEVQKKLHSVITKDYNFFLGRIYFTSNDRSQNTFVFQSTLHSLQLKKDKCTHYVLS